jgi:hypothetical protein
MIWNNTIKAAVSQQITVEMGEGDHLIFYIEIQAKYSILKS